jgi:hypothetical protein
VETDLSLGRLGFEVGGGVVDAQGHDGSPGKGFAFAADAGGPKYAAADGRDMRFARFLNRLVDGTGSL